MRTSLLASTLVLAAAACGSRSSTPIGNTGGPMPTGPAPSVTMQATDGGDFPSTFVATGLPAISNDGKSVAIAVIGEDGARGAPNLAVIEKDRADAVVHEVVVQSADDGEATMGDEGAPVVPTAQLDLANRYLTQTHGARGWFALAPMTLDGNPDEGYGSTFVAHGAGVDLRWDEGKVLVTIAGKTVVDRQTKGWTAVTGPRCDGCDECSNPSFLGGAWIDAERKLIVARIAYTGNDTCWEPDSEQHVIAW